MNLFVELRRRNVLRAAVLYAGAVWALAQGIAQLGPVFGAPGWIVRWFIIAAAIGFPFWIAFAWFYEFTPHGIKRESEVAEDAPSRHSAARKLDFAIIGVLIVAVVLLASGYLVRPKPPINARAAIPGPASARSIPTKSIAVLPFENLSADKNNEYFVAGMQDLILTKLADIGELKVISRTSTAKYASHPEDLRTIGQQLGVATILEGSVQKQGNQVLINVQLIDARGDGHIWAQSYQRTLDNVFGVEGEVAGKIASALKARLSPAETARLASDLSSNDAANDLFLRAEYQTSQGELDYDTASYKAAVPLYRQAILHDRNFALAFARLSYAESALAWLGGGGADANQLAAQARSDASRAIQLAPNLAAAQLALGYSDYWGRADYAGALKAFAAALTLKPDDPDALSAQGYALRRQGRFKDALASLQRAFTLDPRNSVLASAIGATYAFIHRYPDSRNWCERALALDPHNDYAKLCVSESILLAEADVPEALAAAEGDDPALKLQRVRLLTLQGKYQEALTLLDGVPDTPDNFMVANVFNIHGTKALQQAELYRLLGQVASARPLYTQALPKVRAQLVRQHGINRAFAWADLATAQMGLGQIAQALQSIAKSQAIADRSDDRVNGSELVYASAALYAEAHRPDLAVPLLDNALSSPGIGVAYSPVLLWLDPAWNPIRNDPGFQALLKKYARYTPASASSVAVPTASTGAP